MEFYGIMENFMEMDVIELRFLNIKYVLLNKKEREYK